MLARALAATLLHALAACTQLAPLPAPTPTPLGQNVSPPSVAAAWANGGDLSYWRDGETQTLATGGVIQPFVAPDSQHVAFTRGPGGQPESLWTTNAAGTIERRLVAPEDLPSAAGGTTVIHQVGWLDAERLLFNTAVAYPQRTAPQDDLYIANISAGRVARWLDRGEGGEFTVSPNGAHVALVQPGVLGGADGRVVVLDAATAATRTMLTFPGARPPDEPPLVPTVHWDAESMTIRVAIPSWDQPFDPAAQNARTTLWRLPLEGDAAVTGVVLASPLGPPVWSPDARATAYLRYAGGETLELVTADANGANPVVYATGTIDTLGPPRWLPDENRFVYTEDGANYLGAPGEAPLALSKQHALQWLGGGRYAFVSPSSPPYALYVAALDGSPNILVARGLSAAAFHAVHVR